MIMHLRRLSSLMSVLTHLVYNKQDGLMTPDTRKHDSIHTYRYGRMHVTYVII